MDTAPFSGRTYKGVVDALEKYAQRNRISFTDALCHAMQALGAIEAASLKVPLFHVPGAALQEKLFYWGAETNYLAQPISLDAIGRNITDEVVDISSRLVIERAADAYNAYRKANRVDEATTLVKAVYVLLLVEAGDLWQRIERGVFSAFEIVFKAPPN